MGGILVIMLGLLLFIVCALFFFVAVIATTAKGIDVLMHPDPKTGEKM
jgi:hypothetical protein